MALAQATGCGRATGPLRLDGTDLGGRTVTWTPQPGRLSVAVVAPAKGCPGCLASVLASLGVLLDRRPADVDGALIIIDGTSQGLAELCPERAPVVHMSREALERSVPVPGMPLLIVISRGGRLARIDWLPPMQVDPETFADQMERYFTLEE